MPLLTSPRIVVVNSAGQPYALAKMYTYRAGTTTNEPTYTNAGLGTPHTNPIIADANGVFPVIYTDAQSAYTLRIIVTDANDVTLSGWDIDNINQADGPYFGQVIQTNALATNTFAGLVEFNQTFNTTRAKVVSATPVLELNESDASTDKKVWYITADATALYIQTRTDALGAGKNAIVITRGATTALASIAIGNATDLPTITLNGQTLVAADIGQVSTGSFTGTLTGMTASTTGTINYVKTGRVITLYTTANILGTSNAATMTLTGLPAAAAPITSPLSISPCRASDNTGEIYCDVTVTSSLVNFVPLDGDATAGYVVDGVFTSSGTKGVFAGWSITYQTSV